MPGLAERMRDLTRGILPAERGYGPLLQRDYWAVVARCRLKPSEIGALLASRLWELPPPELVTMRRADGTRAPLEVGDELRVSIRAAGTYTVRVLHRSRTSLTVGTLRGHPEAGRITFGAYRNDYGDVVLHIRSRARSASRRSYAGFVVLGEPMQTNTWTDLIDRLAAIVGTGVIGYIHAETRVIPEEGPDAWTSPTYIARGD